MSANWTGTAPSTRENIDEKLRLGIARSRKPALPPDGHHEGTWYSGGDKNDPLRAQTVSVDSM